MRVHYGPRGKTRLVGRDLHVGRDPRCRHGEDLSLTILPVVVGLVRDQYPDFPVRPGSGSLTNTY